MRTNYLKQFLLLIFFIQFLMGTISCTKPKKQSANYNGPIPGLNKDSHYLIYYGDWDQKKIRFAENFDLVILHPHSNINKDMVIDIRNGNDNILNTDDDVYVVAYISIGEEHPGPVREGDGRGPVTWKGEELVYKNNGVAGYYLDADDDGAVDINDIWRSYLVNAGDKNWQKYLKDRVEGFNYIYNKLKCNGFFLDTIDSASPWHLYPWMVKGMSDFIRHIRDWYPKSIIIANRGLFYFYNDFDTGRYDVESDAYEYNIRTFINAVMFECFFSEWNWEKERGEINPWFEQSHKVEAAPHLNREASKKDGFTVLCLDYFCPGQNDYNELVERQLKEVSEQINWLNCITDVKLKSCQNYISGYILEEN